MKVRLKSSVFDAEQFKEGTLVYPDGVKFQPIHPKGPVFFEPTPGAHAIDCLHVVDGDWVVYSEKGKSLYSDAAFREKYEPVLNVASTPVKK